MAPKAIIHTSVWHPILTQLVNNLPEIINLSYFIFKLQCTFGYKMPYQ